MRRSMRDVTFTLLGAAAVGIPVLLMGVAPQAPGKPAITLEEALGKYQKGMEIREFNGAFVFICPDGVWVLQRDGTYNRHMRPSDHPEGS